MLASLLHKSIMLAITEGVNWKISSQIGTSGQFFRSTACAYFSFSQKPMVVYPQACAAIAKPPMPENRSRCVLTFLASLSLLAACPRDAEVRGW